jgi:hypothetical protein
MRPGKRRALNKENAADALIDKAEKIKASIRTKVEHSFRVIKRQFGFVKVRCRGRKKNTAQLITLSALSNLWMVRGKLMGVSWRMDETYIKVNGPWKYLYRAVDKAGKKILFQLTAKRNKKAAMRFFEKAMQANGIPEKVTMDKSGDNKSAIDQII